MSATGHREGQERHGARRKASSMETAPGFERSWRDLRPQLAQLLRARGASPDILEDLLQETAIRLLRTWPKVDHSRSLGPLARTIAINCLIDHQRGRRLVPFEEVPEQPSSYDLESHALARARLSKVEAAIERLADRDRSVLLAEVGLADGVDRSSSKMARLRARKRLVAAMDHVAAAFGGIQTGWRRVGLWFQSLEPAGERLLPVMVGVAGVVTVATVSSPASPPSTEVDREKTRAGVEQLAAERSEIRRAPRARAAAPRTRQPVSTPAQRQGAEERPASERDVVDAGNAKARTTEGKGYKSVEVCTGGSTEDERDDYSYSVTVVDGTQEGDQPDSCS